MPENAPQLVALAVNDKVAMVTLQRAEKLHALTPAMLDQLEAHARAIDAMSNVRCVVLTATGSKAFCVGADIYAWSALTPLDMWRSWVKRGHQVFDQWARLGVPVIAAINGHALGGGLELAVTADIRIATTSSEFGLPEASIGTCPGWSGSQRLAQLIGASRVKYLALTAARMNTDQALQCGLLHEIATAEQLASRALALARQICTLSPVSVQLTKQIIDAGQGLATSVALEAMAGALAASTADGREGIMSFKEKRKPVFRGE